jgi:magnesium-transporting ATPase (P-type)
LERLNDEHLFQAVQEISVYARVSPQHKLRIVQQLLKHGEIVAVTGDGVNDAPALKAAHIGVAMGRAGTDVAKEAADMILTDDNFVSIFKAVEQGRIVFDNIKKVTAYVLTGGVAMLLTIVATMFMGVPIPFNPTQILWVNFATSGLVDVALAFEPGDKSVLDRPPRPTSEGILSRTVIERIVLCSAVLAATTLLTYLWSLGGESSLEKARTVALTTIVFGQFINAFNSRSLEKSIFRTSLRGNPFLLGCLVAAFIGHLAVVFVPALEWLLRTEQLQLKEFLIVAAVSFSVVLPAEIHKRLSLRRLASNQGKK